MKITDQARSLLLEIFKQRNANGIRAYFGGFGWGGPQIGLALDEPEEGDKVEYINGIRVAMDPDIAPYLQGMTLEYDEFSQGLILTGGNSYGCWHQVVLNSQKPLWKQQTIFDFIENDRLESNAPI